MRFIRSIILCAVFIMTTCGNAVESEQKSTAFEMTLINVLDQNAFQLFGQDYNVTGLRFSFFFGSNANIYGVDINPVGLSVVKGDMIGLQINPGVNYVNGSVGPIQLAGISNICQSMNGIQMAVGGNIGYVGGSSYPSIQVAGFFNFYFDFCGLQLAGLGNFAGDANGAQIAIGCNVNGGSSSYYSLLQLAGLFNFTSCDMRGWQLAGVGNYNGGENNGGLQISGFFNFNRKFSGFQLSGLANINEYEMRAGELSQSCVQVAGLFNFETGAMTGVQIAGFLNNAKVIRGVQIGLINYCENLYGIQIGLINIAENAPVSVLPFFNAAF